MKYRSLLITTLFLTSLAFPLVNERSHFINDIASTENRATAKMPAFNINYLDPFPDSFENYYNDHFTLRSKLIRLHTALNIEQYGKSPYPEKVIIGRDGWLFSGGNAMESYCGLNRLTCQELQRMAIELEYRNRYLAAHNCKFYLLVAPDKANVYIDKVPSIFYRFCKKTRLEQLMEYLQRYSHVNAVNILYDLRNNTDKGNLYYKLDNHWNQLGALFAAKVLLKKMHTDNLLIDTISTKHYQILQKPLVGGDLTEMLTYSNGYSDIFYTIQPYNGFKSEEVKYKTYVVPKSFAYPWDYEKRRVKKTKNKPKILVISDSFGEAIFPFLAESFGSGIKIFDSWQYDLNETIVEQEKPDVMVLVILENNLRLLHNHTTIP